MDKTLLTTFPYHQTPEGKLFPITPLKLQVGRKVIDSSALIDSGATISIFRPEVAEELGLKIEKGEEIDLNGVGGRIKGYIHKIKLEIAGKKFFCPIIFSYEYTVSFNLLGREKFFRNFVIVFNEKKGRVELR